MSKEAGAKLALWQMVVPVLLAADRGLFGGPIILTEYMQYLPRAVVWEEYRVDAVEGVVGGAAGDYLAYFSLTWPPEYAGGMIAVEIGYEVYSWNHVRTVQPKCPLGEECEYSGATWIGTGWNQRSCWYSATFTGYQEPWSGYCPGGFVDTLWWPPPITGLVYLDWDSSDAHVLDWGVNAVTTFRFEADVQPWVKWTVWQEVTEPGFLIPEPGAGVLLMLGLAALGLVRRAGAA